MSASRNAAAMMLLPAVAILVSSCSMVFGTPNPDGFALHNETDLELEAKFADGSSQMDFSAGTSSEVGIPRACDTLALVVRHEGREYASITDDRLCDGSTHVYIRGENDIVIAGQ